MKGCGGGGGGTVRPCAQQLNYSAAAICFLFVNLKGEGADLDEVILVDVDRVESFVCEEARGAVKANGGDSDSAVTDYVLCVCYICVRHGGALRVHGHRGARAIHNKRVLAAQRSSRLISVLYTEAAAR